MPRSVAATVLGIFVGGLGVFVWGFVYPTVERLELALSGFVVGALLAVVGAPVLFLGLRGRSRALKELGMTLGLVLLGFAGAAIGGLAVANAKLDTGPGEYRVAQVTDVDSLFVTLELEEEASNRTVVVPRWQVEGDARNDAPARVMVRPGELEYPWVSRVRVVTE